MKDKTAPATQTNAWIVWDTSIAWFEFFAVGTGMCCWACQQIRVSSVVLIKPVIVFGAPYVQMYVEAVQFLSVPGTTVNLCQCFQAQLELSYCMFL